VTRLLGRPFDAELLTVDAPAERVEFEQVMRKNGERGDTIADPGSRRLGRRCFAALC
jgi:hypothetical protein